MALGRLRQGLLVLQVPPPDSAANGAALNGAAANEAALNEAALNGAALKCVKGYQKPRELPPL
ncbi:hypothetical protein AN477_15790 [Alicyclobacillus ferrooxydans]|uniref:Uncharacterized protein n=1 Tax=Alicyclobacillus ferrooxydans TaxID=471514 RepID=A0A0P9D024_9BACL|nr:hypothetical protein AN477_15790 [Alicyclobacillus ferrooxydans]